MSAPMTNRWHPVMLPDDYLRKLRQDLVEADSAADSTTRLEPVLEVVPRENDAQR